MVKLFCAVVGEKGSAFPVTINASESVSDLKKAIKKEKENDLKAIDAEKLQLFLAKNGDAWVTQKQVEEGISDTSDFKPLKIVAVPLQLVGLSEKDVAFELTMDDVGTMNTPVHVLVVISDQEPTATSGVAVQISPPSAPHPHRLQRWSKINHILARNKNKKARTNEEGFTTPYSSSRWTAVGPVFDEDRVKYVECVHPIPASDLEVLSKVLTWIMKCFGWTLIDFKDNEAKRIHVIASIIWAVVQLLPDVTVHIEQDLDGNRVDAHGHFEFVLVRGDKRICIVEAKEEKFKQGMVQALLGCEVAADLDDSHEVYAVVTNVEKWIFLKSLDEEILCDEFNALTFGENGIPHAMELSEVTGKLHSVLTDQQIEQ
nr:crinkler 6 [Plasmopara viticola]